jgi:ketosteroid isomerase-like protein
VRDIHAQLMNPRIVAVLFSAVALLAGCTQPDTERYKAEIIAADKAFCASSIKVGPKAAFLRAIARDCKLLAVDTRSGADAVNSVFIQLPAATTLTWEPAFVDVSASGDLGYTWGRYTLNIPIAKLGAAPLIRRGTYVTIWRRQHGGAWKAVLDGGNQDGTR